MTTFDPFLNWKASTTTKSIQPKTLCRIEIVCLTRKKTQRTIKRYKISRCCPTFCPPVKCAANVTHFSWYCGGSLAKLDDRSYQAQAKMASACRLKHGSKREVNLLREGIDIEMNSKMKFMTKFPLESRRPQMITCLLGTPANCVGDSHQYSAATSSLASVWSGLQKCASRS